MEKSKPIKVVDNPINRAKNMLVGNPPPYRFRLALQLYREQDQQYVGFMPALIVDIGTPEAALSLMDRIRKSLEMK